MNTTQHLITPAMGKRLIAKSLLKLPSIQAALKDRTVVIVAGTTNGYVAEEILTNLGQAKDFQKERFFRGVTLPPQFEKSESGRLPDESQFPGDIVIHQGKWEPGLTIFDVVDDLKKGDVIVKGANAVNRQDRQAALYIGHPQAGTINTAMQAVLGRRVELIVPVGLEKRVSGNINQISNLLNSQDSTGPRYFPFTGTIITEIEALRLLTEVNAQLVAGGGIAGAEGSVWLACSGDNNQLSRSKKIINSIDSESLFNI